MPSLAPRERPCLQPMELPLVLLASVGHPDPEFRHDLRRRLDEATDRTDPLYSTCEWRSLFRRVHRSRKNGLGLNEPLRELAIRVGRLAFPRNSAHSRQRFLVGRGDRFGGLDGILIESNLKVIRLSRSSFTRHRVNRMEADCRLLLTRAATRLEQFQKREPLLRAICRFNEGPRLELTGEFPWSQNANLITSSTLGPTATLSSLGVRTEFMGNTFCIWPGTAEGIIRFSAALATGETLWLRSHGGHGLVVIRLCDNDEEIATLPVLSCLNRSEDWLQRIPLPAMELSQEDKIAITHWAYPVDSWLTAEFLENLS